MSSLRQVGQRLGRVSRRRSRKINPQSRQRDVSRMNRRVLSRASDFTTWAR